MKKKEKEFIYMKMVINLKEYLKKIKNMEEKDIYYENSDIYNGKIKEGRKEGKGEIKFKNGNAFNGIFKDIKVKDI